MFPMSWSWTAKVVLGLAVLSWSALPGEAGKGGGGGGRGGGGGGGRGGSSSARGSSGHSGNHNNGHHHHAGNFGYWPGFGYGYYYPDYGYSTQPVYSSSYYQPITEQNEADAGAEPASITLKVPADPEVWFNDINTKQKGKERLFVSPPRLPSYSYHYQIRTSWTENGQTVTRTREVAIRPGKHVMVEIRGPAPAQP